MVIPAAFTRRSLLLALLAGCAAEAPLPGEAPRHSGPLSVWRSFDGGFIAPALPGGGLPTRPAGPFARLGVVTALALRQSDLLVADATGGRLWRVDTMTGTMSGVAGAPSGPGVALALGPDLSAWVLDPGARQVLRFARDGRLLQTFRAGVATPSPVALTLADGGATLLLADGLGAQWSEQRGGFERLVQPQRADGQRITGVDAIVSEGDALVVLDRLAGVVHRVRRDGRVFETLGRNELVQPSALACARGGRIFVADDGGRALVVLQTGQPAQRVAAQDLGLQHIGAMACDGAWLAAADTTLGRVQLLRLGAP